MYGLEYALPFLRAKAVSPPASLPLLAALTPPQHRVTLIDENVEPIDFARCARADIVGVTGLLVQRTRMKEIIAELKRRGVFVVLGGPLVTSGEDYLGGIADVTFIGEAEETWPRFLAEWQDGRHQIRYEQSEKTDLSRVPVPRYELLKMRRYAFGTVQFSRGCPFTCEFCDIIVHFGRCARTAFRTPSWSMTISSATRRRSRRYCGPSSTGRSAMATRCRFLPRLRSIWRMMPRCCGCWSRPT